MLKTCLIKFQLIDKFLKPEKSENIVPLIKFEYEIESNKSSIERDFRIDGSSVTRLSKSESQELVCNVGQKF